LISQPRCEGAGQIVLLQARTRFAYPLLLLLISLAVVYYLFGPNLWANFGLIDDHEILDYVRKAAGNFRYFFQLIGSTEIGNFGHSVRFRPGYYTIYVTEALVWGANPFLWYLFRFLMCVTFVFACLRVVGRYCGFAAAVLFVALTFSYTYWTDVWSRLGPGESYCAFGLGLFALGFIELIDRSPPKREWPWSLLLLFGVLIGAGAKENFVLLMLPVLALGWVRYRRGTLSWGLATALGVSAAYMTVITGELLTAFSEGRPDIHAEPVSIGSRLHKLNALLSVPAFYYSLGVFILGSIAWLLCYRSSRLVPLHSRMFALAVIGLCGSFLVFTQVIFYNGEWPANVRFDFPGMMTTPVMIASVTALATAFVRLFWPKMPAFIFPLAVLLVFRGPLWTGLNEVRAGSELNQQRTESVRSKIDLVSKTLKQDPRAVLVLETYEAYNYEIIVSIQKFLRFFGVDNPIVVRIHGYDAEHQPNDLFKSLAQVIVGWDQAGRKQLASARKCYSVQISGHEPTNCQDLADF
jgi:hypothetical protein